MGPKTWANITWNEKSVFNLLRYFLLAGATSAEHCTYNAFRAGRATELAARGNPLWSIMVLGEWSDPRSAPKSYINADVAGARTIVEILISKSDDES